MKKYAAFLRAINVGGNNPVKMEELKRVFHSLRFENVQTYIQSGNVIFRAEENDEKILRSEIEKQLSKSFGFKIVTLVRSEKEINDIVKANPFGDKHLSKELVLYMAFLSNIAGKKIIEALTSCSNENEAFRIQKNNAYCLINKKVKTLFSNNWLEKKLGMEATTRNWNTILKMQDLLTSDN